MNGKGDKRRKRTVSQETWEKNWERIFGDKKNKNKNISRESRN